MKRHIINYFLQNTKIVAELTVQLTAYLQARQRDSIVLMSQARLTSMMIKKKSQINRHQKIKGHYETKKTKELSDMRSNLRRLTDQK